MVSGTSVVVLVIVRVSTEVSDNSIVGGVGRHSVVGSTVWLVVMR